MVGQTVLRNDEMFWVADVGVLYCTALKGYGEGSDSLGRVDTQFATLYADTCCKGCDGTPGKVLYLRKKIRMRHHSVIGRVARLGLDRDEA